jgi:tetratricopeptide (TPR) repeat protein
VIDALLAAGEIGEAARFEEQAVALVNRAIDAGPDALQRVRAATLLALLGNASAARGQLALAREAFRPGNKAFELQGVSSTEAANAIAAG